MERYDDEIIANSDSDYMDEDNVSSVESELDTNDSDSDSDFPAVRRHIRRNIISSDSDSDNPEWSDTDDYPGLEQFLDNPGVQMVQNNPTNIMDSVKLFIDEDLFTFFVQESNKYYHQNSHHYKKMKKKQKMD